MNTLDVLYTSDNRYLDIMLGSIASLIRNSQVENICVHIISANLNRNDYEKIVRFFSKYPNVKYNIYPLEEFDIEKYHIPDWRNTQIANARLFFTDIMREKISGIENLLYLDSDTCVVGDLTSLDQFQDVTIGACKDNNCLELLKKYQIPMYYNSGVLFINIDRWVEEKCKEKILEEIYHPHTELNFPDQDIINIALQRDIEALPIQYNLMPYEYLFDSIDERLFFNSSIKCRSYQEVEEALACPKIYHGCGLVGIKPWSNNTINPFNEMFMRYILDVNPDFEMEELTSFQKLLDRHPFLLKKALVLKTYLPQSLYDLIGEMSMKMQKIRPKQYRKQ